MITNIQELKETFESFNDNNDEFPSTVDVVISQGVDEYALIYTGQEPIAPKDFTLPISGEDFEILLAEFWDYIDWYLEVEPSDSQHQPDKLIETIADAQEFVASKYPQHSTDTVFKPHESRLNAISFSTPDGFVTAIEIPCTIESFELALQISWGE